MKKIAFSLIVGLLFLGNGSHLHAQILNGSFGNGFNDWTLVGGGDTGMVGPQVVTSGATPPISSTAALVQSEDGDTGATTASVAAIEAAFNAADTADTTYSALTLPSTTGDALSGYPGDHPAVNGQAIYQTFTLSNTATLSFVYSFQSFDSIPFDRTGYVLNGDYHQLASPTEPYYDSPDPTPTGYAPVYLTLNPGTYTLGFVAYNTGDNTLSSSLYVTDVSVPEPGEWKLIALGCVGLLIVRKLRSKLSAIQPGC